jgi:hypothetical protein
VRQLSRPSTFCVLSLLFCLPACNSQSASRDFSNYAPLAAGVRKANKVILYEGLPHQFFEEGLLESELNTKKTVYYHGYPFYLEPLELKEPDIKELTDLFCDPKSFRAMPPNSGKACGGFHPDYAIEWHDGNDVYRVLICFGCYEIKVFGPRNSLYCDIASDAYKKFERILKPYRKNRPK